MRTSARPLLVALGAATIAAGLLAGCSSPPAPATAGITVTSASSLLDQPVDIVVSGLGPGQAVTVGLKSVDAAGVTWTSAADFRSNAAGTVNLATAAASGGSYRGVDPMGLVDALQPAPQQSVLYAWDGAVPQRFLITVAQGGTTVATAGFSRAEAAPGVTVSAEVPGRRARQRDRPLRADLIARR